MRGRIRPLLAASALIRIAACLPALAVAGACGSDAPPPISLLTAAAWNDDPATLAEIGYRVSVDFGWQSRAQSCFSLPTDLTVTMNEREVIPTQLGECVWDILVRFDAVPPDAPVHVRVASGSQVYGEATYDDLFPGFGAQLVPPGDGTVRSGSQFVVALPPTAVPVAGDLGFGLLYWLDTAPPAVPFYTFAPGMGGSDPQTIEITAPATAGRATLIVKSVFKSAFGSATSCSGFDHCISLPSSEDAGPLAINVVP
jgi:hypothetical protein